MTLWKWSKTAATNSNADATINWAEGQAPSSVNDSARALMAAVAKFRDDESGLVVTAGTATAYTATSNQVLTALTDGFAITLQVHTTSGAAPTLSLDSLTAKAIRTATGVAVPTGKLVAGSIHRMHYDLSDDCWYLRDFIPETTIIASTTAMLFQQTSAPTGWTKVVTHNDKALRVVSGAVVNGGTVDFTTAFASQTPAGTIGGTAITEAQMPLHGHPFRLNVNSSSASRTTGGLMMGLDSLTNVAAYTGTPDDTLGHQIGGTGGGATHTHSFTGSAINLAVKYVDCIIATRD